ncbi:Sphingosine-1-phosphate lyase [Neofusicoccum parvum]|uniref:Sphingosine-1-phosphate lyase n=1 Tax=Neofusicoccum parvum TaxID=310453 RepID=A0ACB5RQJ3_9PEZI|nr:Sphingosine-1-phosphate lyase [Neofusicoccum parvum]
MTFLRTSVLALAVALILAFAPFPELQQLLKPSVWPFSFSPLQSSQPVVVLPQGKIVGKVLQEGWPQPLEAFRGVPFSKPPTGPRRFRPLEALEASNSTVYALEIGPPCPGKSFRDPPPVPYDESCMVVNIFRPVGVNSSAGLPVGLYIPGGAFNRGHASMADIGSMVANSDAPFIGVSFQYRIGALGFLPSGLTEEQGLLNLGLRDIIFFFNWLRDNISQFGGNPEDVTVFALSAGAHAIGHMIMNHDEPFFQRAIMESGGPTARAVHKPTSKLHEVQFAEFIEAAGCGKVPGDSAEVFDCLRQQPSETVITASFDIFDKYNPSLRWAFQPTIDGTTIKGRQTDAWLSGRWHKIPILTGFTTNEAASYVPKSLDKPEEFSEYFRVLLPELTDEDINELEKLYPDPSTDESSPYVESRPIDNIGSQYKRAEAAYAHYAYVCPVYANALHASPEVPVYVYRWATNSSVLRGADHGDQKPYETYTRAARGGSPLHEQMAGELHAYWTSFITQSGDPNALEGSRAAGRVPWQPFRKGEREVKMLFGEGNDELAGGSGVGVASQMVDATWARKECDWWFSKGKKVYQ